MSGAALLVAPWALLSVHLRPFVVVALLAALVAAAYRASRMAIGAKAGVHQRRLALQSSIACLFGLVLIDGLAGRLAPSRTTDLHFPLEGGAYAVLQGGNSLVTNPFHHWFPSDKYGLDLVKVNALGNRARGISPEGLNDYESYDVAVHSPCLESWRRPWTTFPTTLRERRIRSTSRGTTFCCAAERCECSWRTYVAEVWP